MTNKETEVTPSCGCIFCDLGLPTKDGFHKFTTGEVISCSINPPKKITDYGGLEAMIGKIYEG